MAPRPKIGLSPSEGAASLVAGVLGWRRSRPRRVGLVLSGGGAYGAFQAGLVHALRRDGVSFPAIAGSSIGAFNGTLAAHDSHELLGVWRKLPKPLLRESRLADQQWRRVLRAFADAEVVWREAGRAYAVPRLVAGGIAGGVAGAAVGASAAAATGAKIGAIGGGVVGAALGAAAAAAITWLCCEDDARNYGREAALRYINGVLREHGDRPLLNAGAVEALRDLVGGARRGAKVFATVAECPKFSARHILAIRERRSSEVVTSGRYLETRRSDAVDSVIASMALPLVMGRRNDLNPSPYLDGGLFDNLPIAALAPAVKAGDLDFLLVVDVSQSLGAFRQSMKAYDLDVPVLYVSLARPSGMAGMRDMLNFDMAPSLFELGQGAAAQAMKKWFANSFFDPVRSWEAKTAILPAEHALQFRHEGLVP